MNRHQLALEPRLRGLRAQADHLAGEALLERHPAAGPLDAFVRQMDLVLDLARRQREGACHAGDLRRGWPERARRKETARVAHAR